MSGGQRQRVAMGRAIVRSPQVFCMDEPLSNLDAKLRVQTRTQIAALQRRLGVTTVYVTHDQVEAMTMGDRVAVLKGGVLQQVDKPRHMYDHPNNVFVAGFIGSPAMNLFEVPVTGDGAAPSFGGHAFQIPREALQGATSGSVTLGVRPENLTVGDSGVEAEVILVEELGSDAFVHAGVQQQGGGETVLVARVDPTRPPEKGDRVKLCPSGIVHAFDTATGARLTRS